MVRHRQVCDSEEMEYCISINCIADSCDILVSLRIRWVKVRKKSAEIKLFSEKSGRFAVFQFYSFGIGRFWQTGHGDNIAEVSNDKAAAAFDLKFSGTLSSFGSSENEYWVFAMQTG